MPRTPEVKKKSQPVKSPSESPRDRLVAGINEVAGKVMTSMLLGYLF